MSQPKEDDLFDALLFRAMVPKGFRPSNDAEIEQMLNALGAVEVPEAKLSRMLGKISGAIPKGWEDGIEVQPDTEDESAEAREMAELYRARGEALPPELEAKLKEMERRASEPLAGGEEADEE